MKGRKTYLIFLICSVILLATSYPLSVLGMQNNISIYSYGEIQTITEGIQIVGNQFRLNGQNSRLTGVNINLWPDADSRYKDKYFDWLRDWDINTIMLNFGWNHIESSRGTYNQDYIEVMDRFIAKAKARGIYVILRMLKWAYPGAYQADYQPWPQSWIMGFPTWIGSCPGFWENIGDCWNRYVAMWTMLAEHYKYEPYVAGFELFAEPGADIGPAYGDENWENWDCNACRKVMGVLFDEEKLYERTINSIHSVSNKPVIIEGFAYGVLRYIKKIGDTDRSLAFKPNSVNFAVGQSVYSWFRFEWLDEQKAVTDQWNVPFMATEFGVQVDIITSPEAEKVARIEDSCQAFASRNMGWFYWGFGPGPDGDFNLVHEYTDAISPILSNTLSSNTFGFLPAPQ